MRRPAHALVSVLVSLHLVLATQTSQKIYWAAGGDECLGVYSLANDVPTEIVSCSDSNAYSDWIYMQPGDNLSIQLAGTNFCLDAGSNPSNYGPAKVYTCYPGLPQQHWYFTADDHIAITGGTQCLERVGGHGAGAPQTYQCEAGDTSQQWATSNPIPS